jgi:nucleotide-binding universal stress UspA family protein
MGTHGRRGYQRWLLGSVTERMLRKAACPVLTVPHEASGLASSPEQWTTIVCPVDFSPGSLAALEYALSLAQQVCARLVLLHVVEWFLEEAAASNAYPEFARYYRALHDEAVDRVRALIPEGARDWCRPEERITRGKPYEAILEVAAETSASVIVMGAQGRTGLGLALFGSTTQHVIRAAACPVLCVRPHVAETATGAS